MSVVVISRLRPSICLTCTCTSTGVVVSPNDGVASVVAGSPLAQRFWPLLLLRRLQQPAVWNASAEKVTQRECCCESFCAFSQTRVVALARASGREVFRTQAAGTTSDAGSFAAKLKQNAPCRANGFDGFNVCEWWTVTRTNQGSCHVPPFERRSLALLFVTLSQSQRCRHP